MKHLNLTKASKKELEGWHQGSGYMFLSAGSRAIQMCFIRLVKNKAGTLLMMGNSRAVKLTPEQEAVIGDFAILESEE